MVIDNPTIHLKYVAGLPCNLSIIVCFLTGSVGTRIRYGGIFRKHLLQIYWGNLLEKEF